MSRSKCVKVKSVECEDVDLLNKSFLVSCAWICWMWFTGNVMSENCNCSLKSDVDFWVRFMNVDCEDSSRFWFVKLVCECDSWIWFVKLNCEWCSWKWFVNLIHECLRECGLWIGFMTGVHENDSWMSSQIWSGESPASEWGFITNPTPYGS